MIERKWSVFLLLFYPFSFVTVMTGLLAFLLLLAGVERRILVPCVLWFYFASFLSVYLMARRILRKFGFERLFFLSILTLGLLSLLSLLPLL
ncbi:MAG: hypothetical protein DSO02_04345 [Hadesarchaea archaeon]|nr:MAG: hypothetical protein DSO02_04345 [Hadesarchaea archaeon]